MFVRFAEDLSCGVTSGRSNCIILTPGSLMRTELAIRDLAGKDDELHLNFEKDLNHEVA